MGYGPAALQDVLKGVTFSVEPRMKVAVVGFSAARGIPVVDVTKQPSHRFEAPPAAENPACCSLEKGVNVLFHLGLLQLLRIRYNLNDARLALLRIIEPRGGKIVINGPAARNWCTKLTCRSRNNMLAAP